MRILRYLILIFGIPALAQAPQIPVTGTIGPGGLFAFRNASPVSITSDANHTMAYPETSGGFVKVTSTVSLTATRNVVEPFLTNGQCFENLTTGGQNIQIIGASGTGVTIANGTYACVQGDGTNYVTGSSGGGTPFAGVGVPYATSTSASTVATSPQVVTALNTSPSTTLAPALLPLATMGAFGAVKPDGTTCTTSAGVLTCAGGGTSVNVNSSPVSNPNFQSATPAAGANEVNVTFQVSSSSVSAEVPAGTTSTPGVVQYDGVTVTKNGSNQLVAAGGNPPWFPISGLPGIHQNCDLNSGGGTGDAAIINTALNGAHPYLIQDKGKCSLLEANVSGPVAGNWGLAGTAAGMAQVAITASSIVSNVAIFTTATQTLPLVAGQTVYVGNFTNCTALNYQVVSSINYPTALVVSATGLSTTGFQAPFTSANCSSASEAAATAGWLVGSGFYLANGVNPSVAIGTPVAYQTPGRGGPMVLQNFALNGNAVNNNSTLYNTAVSISSSEGSVVDGLVLFNDYSFNLGVSNTGHATVRYNKTLPFPAGVPPARTYTDGIHIYSGNDLVITGNYYHVGDDSLAFNALEADAPISRVRVSNEIMDQCFDFIRLYTGSIPGTQINDVTFVNVGGTQMSGVSVPIVFVGNASYGGTGTTPNSITNVTWSNSTVTTSSNTINPFFSMVDSIGSLTLDNIRFNCGYLECPVFSAGGGVNFTVSDLHIHNLELGMPLATYSYQTPPGLFGSSNAFTGTIGVLDINGLTQVTIPGGSGTHANPIPYIINQSQNASPVTIGSVTYNGIDHAQIGQLTDNAAYITGGVSTSEQPVINSGAIERWSTGEGRGATFTNSGPDFSNSASFNGTWTSVAGHNGLSATFNGTSQGSVSSSYANTNFDGSVQFGTCGWSFPTSYGASFSLIGNMNDGGTNNAGWLVYGTSGGFIIYLINVYPTTYDTWTVPITAYPLNQWHFVCVDYDGTSSTTSISMSIDGVAQTVTNTNSTLSGSIASGTPVKIGCRGTTTCSSGYFTGSMGPQIIFNRAPSLLEQKIMYSNGLNPN